MSDRRLSRPLDGVTTGMPENPHELLGLAAGERDPLVIVEAARLRLGILRAHRGSEIAVVGHLVRQIKAARDAMLEAARPPRWRRGGQPPAGAEASWPSPEAGG